MRLNSHMPVAALAAPAIVALGLTIWFLQLGPAEAQAVSSPGQAGVAQWAMIAAAIAAAGDQEDGQHWPADEGQDRKAHGHQHTLRVGKSGVRAGGPSHPSMALFAARDGYCSRSQRRPRGALR